jgi:ATP-binding cassette, subfamily B, bacterial MsbA
MKSTRSLTARLFQAVRPYKGVMAISLLAMVGAAALEPVLPALLKPLVDQSLIAKDHSAMWQVPLLLLLAFLGKGIAEYIANVSSQWVSNKAIHDLRCQVFRHQMQLPLSTHLQQTQGRMLSRLLYDIPQVGAALSSAWIIVIRDTLVIIGLLAYLFWTAWQLTVLILAIAPFVAWLIKVASHKLRGGNQAIQDTTAELTGTIEESLNGVREIKLFHTYAHEGQRFADVSERLRHETMATVRVAALNVPLVQVLAAAAVSTVIWVATNLSAQDQLSPGAFVAFVAAMSMVFEPIRRLTNINPVIQKGLAGAQSLYEVLDSLGEPDAHADGPWPRAQGHLQLSQVCFQYPEQTEAALADITLHIQRGQTIALVGASGSGKTTLINLIARFFEPTTGTITLDGQPLHSLPLAQVRAQMAWVGQHVVLFDDTVAANIAYGQPHVSETQIEAAARAANAWEFIQQLPLGLQTPIGINGSQLSGGQRQRLAIARAFLKDAPILLLDEATSALDNLSEQAIKGALQRLRQDRTVLVVAHRLSTVRDADLIVVMERGRVIESGSHDALERANGAYARLLSSADGLQDDLSTN